MDLPYRLIDSHVLWVDTAGTQQQVQSKILDLILYNQVEYLIAEDDLRIRLDRLVAINGVL